MGEDADSTERTAQVILTRYESTVRAELSELGSSLLPELDAAAALLRSALASPDEVKVGFLGESQVGKSSLINSLIDRLALPTGGVGPLTAQATHLSYGTPSAIEVRYHDRKRINQFVFALRQHLVARGELETDADPEVIDEDDDDTTAQIWSATIADDPDGAPEKLGRPRGMGEHLLDQARLMLGAGDSSLPRAALHAGMKAILARDQPLPAELTELSSRIAEIQEALGTTMKISAADGASAFQEHVELNAAGWRSPLVAELNLALDVQLLEHVKLVDLPGVGVVGDPAGKRAEEFVQNDASALVIVARNNGLTEEVVGLLERTGVITRLLFGGDGDRVVPIHVMFVITHLDDVAEDHYRRTRTKNRAAGLPIPTPDQVFFGLADEMVRKTREQIRRTLEKSPQFEDLPADARTRREQVVEKLCDDLEVFCVSAKEYLKLRDEDDRARAFLQSEGATNIPLLREQLIQLSRRASESRARRVALALDSFRELLSSHLEALAALGSKESSGAARFRAELSKIAPSFQERAKAQRRELYRFLNESIPPMLNDITGEAAQNAHRKLAKLHKDGQNRHWTQLNAALLRHGTYELRSIDYPGTLTKSFVEVIAACWEPSIVEEVRKAVRAVISQHIELVEEFLAEASKLSGGDELLFHITAQKRQLKEQGRSAVEWTAQQLHDLSEEVRTRIGTVVGSPIIKACKDAQRAGENRGSGARKRILDMFMQGGSKAISAAQAASFEILNDQFRKLRQSLGRMVRENEDPITLCYEAIVDLGAAKAEKRGAAERARKIDAVSRIHAALNQPPPVQDAPIIIDRVSIIPRIPTPHPIKPPARDPGIFDFAEELS